VGGSENVHVLVWISTSTFMVFIYFLYHGVNYIIQAVCELCRVATWWEKKLGELKTTFLISNLLS
jgi:hypothetical protein